ncbi:MAG: YdcF family protein [Firmicutes bacterium]|nr:YdcF family protein [Bacillota bacterium]
MKFDTRDKKPNIWNVAVLSAVTAGVLALLLSAKDINFLAVSVTVCLYLALTVIFLAAAFVKQVHYNPYSYNTIYYAGFALFALAALLAEIVISIRVGRMDLSGAATVTNVFGTLLGSAKNYMLVSFPFILIYSLGLCLSNIALIRHEGRRPVNFLGIILAFLLVGGEVYLFASNYYVSGSQREVMIHDLFANLFAAVYLYFECMLIGSIIANIVAVRYEPEKDKDYLIVLGCGLREDGTPTPLLAGRVERALRFYREQIEQTGKAPLFITSGGQGPNEVISESASMKAYLLEKGVPEEHVLQEDRSASTYENMLFSKEIIRADGKKGKVAYATTNYHVFRSGLMARRVGLRAVGMGAKTKWYFWPNAAVREFVGILTEHRLKQALILGSMIVLYCVSTIIYYTYL